MRVAVSEPLDQGRYGALRRLCELLRHARNGTDPAPHTLPPQRRHGEHDQTVGRYVHVDLDGHDHRIYYEEAGSGVGLLCQHTAGSDSRQWRHLLEDERVTSRFRVVAYDLPHHGKSLPSPSEAWWARKYSLSKERAMAVPRALADVLGLDRPVFMGSSVGGQLALDLARYHPDEFRAVIACEAGLKIGQERTTGWPSDRPQAPDPGVVAMKMMWSMSPSAPEALRHEVRLEYAQGAPGIFPGDIDYFSYEHDLRGEAHLIDTDGTRAPLHQHLRPPRPCLPRSRRTSRFRDRPSSWWTASATSQWPRTRTLFIEAILPALEKAASS